jgi:energy-coupling factor transport system ATP-binding protein
MSALIELEKATFAYPLGRAAKSDTESVSGIRDISLRIEAGEYVAIIGANGSGKTTLARHLNALLVPDTGKVKVAGLDTRDPDNHREIRRTVGMVFQHPEDQIVASIVEEDVAFGLENLGTSSEVIRARVREMLEMMGLWSERLRPPHMLSVGQIQRVALAGVLAMRPRCIVFDEATAMLDPVGRHMIRETMKQLHDEGLTVITITHFMDEVMDAERVILLDQGRIALDAAPQRIFSDTETLYALGLTLPPAANLARVLQQHFQMDHGYRLPTGLLTVSSLVEALDTFCKHAFPDNLRRDELQAATSRLKHNATTALPLIDVHRLGYTYMQGTPLARQALAEVSLSVAEEETRGLIGATGSGKSTLMQHLNGLLRPQRGQVRVDGFDLCNPDVDVQAVRRYVGLAFQRPERQIFEQYVGDEIAYGPRLMGVEGSALREHVRWAMDLIGLDFDRFKDRLTFTLSGGERRKVALASVLVLRPRVLLLDEPTAGLDPASRQHLLSRFVELKASGLTLVISSHQMEDLAILADRLTVLEKGSTALDGNVNEVFAQHERLRELGLGLPVVTQVAESLRTRGWPLPAGIVTVEALICHLGARST